MRYYYNNTQRLSPCYNQLLDELTYEQKLNMLDKKWNSKLINKNTEYNGATFNPLNIFSNKTGEDGMLMRLDEKLARIQANTLKGKEPRKDDVFDTVGTLKNYSILKEWYK